MSFIHLTTVIYAPVDRVFDLSRSVSLHKQSMSNHEETVIAGRSSGLFEINETVTWQAKHLGKSRQMRTQITALNKPEYFRDEMLTGDFTSFQHDHYFKSMDNGSIMIDQVNFTCPYGKLGQWFDKFYLHKYMKKLLQQRNNTIKSFAEGNGWTKILF